MGPLKLVAGAGTKPATFANISNPEPDEPINTSDP